MKKTKLKKTESEKKITVNKFDVFICNLFGWHRVVNGVCVRCGSKVES